MGFEGEVVAGATAGALGAAAAVVLVALVVEVEVGGGQADVAVLDGLAFYSTGLVRLN